MEKDLYKKYPFTAFAFVLIGALFLQSMLVGNDSVMTNAIIQAGWCKAGNYICLVWRYASISLLIIFLGLLIDGLVKWLSNKRNFKKGKTEIEISSKSLPEEKVRRPKVVDRFSFHLDAGIKELNKHPLFKLSSNGRNFLQRIKNSPPFLGLDFGQ